MGRHILDALRFDHEMALYCPVGLKYTLEYLYPDQEFTGMRPTLPVQIPRKGVIEVKGIPVYPGTQEDMGENLIEQHYDHFNADLLIQIGETWPLKIIPALADRGKIEWCHSPPLDFLDPIPGYVIDKLSKARRIVTWGECDKLRLAKYGLADKCVTIPPMLDTRIWRPLKREDYPATMKSMDFALDTFNILIVAANQFMRKAWNETLEGISIFVRRTGARARIYIHTFPGMGEHWDLIELLKSHGLAEIAVQSRDYENYLGEFSEVDLVKMFNMASVALTCGAEGYGYSIVQANAVGVPCVTMDFGPGAEALGAGAKFPVGHTMKMPDMLIRVIPRPEHIAAALEGIHEKPRKTWRKGIKHVRENYSTDVLAPKWLKLVNEIDQELEDLCIKKGRYPPSPSESLRPMEQEVVILS